MCGHAPRVSVTPLPLARSASDDTRAWGERRTALPARSLTLCHSPEQADSRLFTRVWSHARCAVGARSTSGATFRRIILLVVRDAPEKAEGENRPLTSIQTMRTRHRPPSTGGNPSVDGRLLPMALGGRNRAQHAGVLDTSTGAHVAD